MFVINLYLLVGELVKLLQPWPFEPLIHMDRSCDLGIPLEYERFGTYMNEA
jgi:hypothetical protein